EHARPQMWRCVRSYFTGLPALTGGAAGVTSAPLLGRAAAMRIPTTRLLATFFLAPLTLCLAPAPAGLAQEEGATPVQIVALDECAPASFALALGVDFCKNVAVGYGTRFADLFAQAAAGKPDPGWDFEPDKVTINQGTPLVVVDQGGEPHTFTEVAKFGG